MVQQQTYMSINGDHYLGHWFVAQIECLFVTGDCLFSPSHAVMPHFIVRLTLFTVRQDKGSYSYIHIGYNVTAGSYAYEFQHETHMIHTGRGEAIGSPYL